jgi:hypothetical protein
MLAAERRLRSDVPKTDVKIIHTARQIWQECFNKDRICRQRRWTSGWREKKTDTETSFIRARRSATKCLISDKQSQSFEAVKAEAVSLAGASWGAEHDKAFGISVQPTTFW